MKVVERQQGINELGNCASFSYSPHHLSSEHSSPLPQATPLSARCKLKNPYRQSVKSTTSLESQRTKQSKLGQILIERNLRQHFTVVTSKSLLFTLLTYAGCLVLAAYCLRPDASCALNLNHEPNAMIPFIHELGFS